MNSRHRTHRWMSIALAVTGAVFVRLVPFVLADPQIAVVLDLVFLATPLVIVAIAAMTRQPGERELHSALSRSSTH